MSLVPLLPQAGLVRVIYASRWGACVGEDVHHVARQIVAHSAQTNSANDVTSLLLVHGGWFMQVLEGPAGAVRDTFARIAADHRHFDITVLASGAVDRRLFDEAAMDERRIAPTDRRLLEDLGMTGKFTPAQLDAERALFLMNAVGHKIAA